MYIYIYPAEQNNASHSIDRTMASCMFCFFFVTLVIVFILTDARPHYRTEMEIKERKKTIPNDFLDPIMRLVDEQMKRGTPELTLWTYRRRHFRQ